jgi:hypothetical protein
MKCPTCGTDGVERGVCFYCKARKERKKVKNRNGKESGGERKNTQSA